MKNQELLLTLPNGRVFRAVVRSSHVALQDGADNSEIFSELGIYDKTSFCAAAYGYRPTKGNWPWFREGDYSALERLFSSFCQLGVVITRTGATQKKHLSKPAATNVCKPPCGSQKCASPVVQKVDINNGYQPSFRSPLCEMTHKF